MKVLFLAAEAAPLSKAGGLGDVAGALPKALAALGHDVRVAIPFAGVIDRAKFNPRVLTRFQVPHRDGAQTATVSEVRHAGQLYYLIAGPPIPRARRIYGADIAEDGPKFVFFSLAALGLCRALDWAPDVLHANDAHTGPAVYWLDTDGARDPFFRATASVFTIHNLVYMNTGAGPALRAYGLVPSDAPVLPDWARDSLMGLGLAHADALNAVSPTYAREILTPEFGCGLEGALAARGERLVGILNGLDLGQWDPEQDGHLATRYAVESLGRRAGNKRALQLAEGLPAEARTPLVVVISRLDTQKGMDIALPAVRRLLREAGQFILLGTGLPPLEAQFKALGAEFPERARVHLRFDSALASRLYAAADVVLIPSRYEPCGLTQMIAMRYGAVPIVRRTGGLADTVIDYDVPRRGNGFVFTDYNAQALTQALQRALRVYGQAARWRALQARAMRRARRFSWAQAAQHYLTLYQRARGYRQVHVHELAARLQ